MGKIEDLMSNKRALVDTAKIDLLETIIGLRMATPKRVVRKMNNSEVKCPNAIRYENRAMS
jgi:hypothetical protein